MKGVKTSGGTHTIQFGTTPIRFDLLYSARTTLSLRVYPDRTIEVDAPHDTEYATVEAFVRRRGGWILRQLHELGTYDRSSAVLPRRYVSGESYRYLGRQYRLKVVEDPVERVILSRGWLFVNLHKSTDNRRVQTLLSAWYRTHAQRVFTERLAACTPRVEPLGIPMPHLSIRIMKLRWGSCSSRGTMTLNLNLIQAPRSLIDYVILHELCHLKVRNHGPEFRSLMDRVLPGWPRLREELNHYEFGQI